jgi:hypothetical protein
VDEYCAIANEGADVDDPRLCRLRTRMTADERSRAHARLEGEAEALSSEADQLEAWGRSRKVVPLRSPSTSGEL